MNKELLDKVKRLLTVTVGEGQWKRYLVVIFTLLSKVHDFSLPQIRWYEINDSTIVRRRGSSSDLQITSSFQ